MAARGPKLEREQVLLGRFVVIGAEIFAIATSCARAQSMLGTRENTNMELLALADYLCCASRLRIDRMFCSIRHNVDLRGKKLAERVLGGELVWLQNGIV